MTETIIAAAVRIKTPEYFASQVWRGKLSYPEYLTITAQAPARHHSLLNPLSELTSGMVGPDNQGFVTSTGRYVGREEGLKIALASGQAMIDHPSRHDTLLFSEDLW